MQKGHQLCIGQKKREFETEIHRFLLKAKKMRWLKKNQLDIDEKETLFCYMESIINEKFTKPESDALNQKLQKALGVDEKPSSLEIPDYLECKITLSLMEDPVILSSGNTYEKVAIHEHFKKNGHIDPVTREHIDPHKIYHNLHIKQATEDFLTKHPWAYKYIPGDTFENIKF